MRHSRHLLRSIAEDHKKPQDSITGILLDISNSDLGNCVTSRDYNIQCSKQLSYASMQNRIPGIPSVCFSTMKLQTWTLCYRVVLAGLRYVHLPVITLSNHIHGAIWCSMNEVWNCEAYGQPCSRSLSKHCIEIQFLHYRKQCIFIIGINCLHGNNRYVIISNTWNTQMHSAD
jgi:hypothetical protein